MKLLWGLSLLWASACRADYENLVTEEYAASQQYPSWFDNLSDYKMPDAPMPAGVPVSPSVPADAPARDMVFGSPLSFTVFPVNPSSAFGVELTFLDDGSGGGRVESLANALSPAWTLPAGAIYVVRVNLSASAVSPSGVLALDFSVTRGPNAILSSFRLFSSNASDPPIRPPAPRLPSHDLPRLTPRPPTVNGVNQTILPLMGTWSFDPAPTAALLRELAASQGGGALLRANAWTTINVPGEYTLQGFRINASDPVVYHTNFSVPPGWADPTLQLKLRCDGIYSNATVYVNGIYVGAHVGGFTPFEVDMTASLNAGSPVNNLTIVVVGASRAFETRR